MSLTDFYRTFLPNTKECTFFSAAHKTFPTSGHILGHKTNLNTYRKNEITSYMLCDLKGI